MHGLAAKSLRALFLTFVLALMCVAAAPPAGHGQQAMGGLQAPALEQLFPKRGWLLGLAPRTVQFCADGKQAAFIDRGELWLMDVATGRTNAAVLESTLAGFRNNDPDKPVRFTGISSYVWSQDGKEMLFAAEGYVYRLTLETGKVERLANQRFLYWHENLPEKLLYLPDGSGYVVVRGLSYRFVDVWLGNLSNNRIQAWQARLPEVGYVVDMQISPDGRSLVVMARKGAAPWEARSEVEIVNFRGAQLKTVRVKRQLPGDDVPAGQVDVYVASITALTENAAITTKVYSAINSSAADWVSVANWSLDSRQFTFAHFEQKTAQVRILVAGLDAPGSRDDRRDQNSRYDGQLTGAEGRGGWAAREVHRFSHTGGPSTPCMIVPWFLADHKTVVFCCEESGFLQLHTLDAVSGRTSQLTSGSFEIYPVTLSADRRELYVAATKEHPSRRDLYRVDLATGAMERLTTAQGCYGDIYRDRPESIINVAISPDGRTLLTTFENFGTLKELVRVELPAGTQQTVTKSHGELATRLATARPEFFSFTNRHGDEIHGYVFKPRNWQATDKRPALIYAYGGQLGISKTVLDGNMSPDHLFALYMAEKHGYVTVVIDPRGSSGYGARFESANFGRPGQAAVEDLEDAVKHLVANYGVDAQRVGLHGWSFGGFLTQMCMYTSKSFAVGIAGAGPTEWHNYSKWYTATTIGEPGPGGENLRKFSLLPLAKNLQGSLLLVHGLEDDNVLAQDTIRVYRELLRAGKATQVELFLDPTGNHGLYGDVLALDKYRKYEQFLLQRLGSGN